MDFKNKNEKTFYADEAVEVNPKNLRANVSKIGYDESEKIFWTTIDRISLKNIYDVVAEVLQAHQYVPNFENILACLDQTGIGVRGQTKEGQLKKFNYVLYFKMPQKNRKGSLLKNFYEEISIYEKAILLSKNKIEKKQPEDSTEDLVKENAQLKAMLAKMVQSQGKNADVWIHQPSSGSGDESFKVATVQNIRPSQRQISIKVEQKSFHHPTSKLTAMPETGQNCLVYYADGQVKDVWFMEATQKIWQRSAVVLFKDKQLIKVRDINRRTYVIHATNQEERALFDRITRGSLIQIGSFNNHITFLQELRQKSVQNYSEMIQEKIATEQLDNALEEQSQENKKSKKKFRKAS